MRALRRNFLASLVMAIAALYAGMPAQALIATSASTTHHIIVRDCPQGTNWDNITQTCH